MPDSSVKTVNVDPTSTAASDLLASGGGSDEALDALNALNASNVSNVSKASNASSEDLAALDALDALEVMDTMSDDGFFGKGDDGLPPSPNTPATPPPPLDLDPDAAAATHHHLPDDSHPLEISRSPSLSTCLGTESLIASGCVFTIFEQFFRPTKRVPGGADDDNRSNITDTLKDIAGHLEKISLSLEKIASASTPPATAVPEEQYP